MKFFIIALTFAVSVFAIDIEVVDCETTLKLDPPPLDKILSDTYEDIEQNPSDFVCAYDACDFHHNAGWFAIKKDRNVVFYWDKKENTTTTMLGEYGDTGFSLARVKFDKYGIRDVGGWSGKEAYEYRDLTIKVLLIPVSKCTGMYDTEKTDCPPSWQDSNGKCKQGW